MAALAPAMAGQSAAIYSLEQDMKLQRQNLGPTTPSRRRNHKRMIQKVRAFWITGVLEPSLHKAPFITPELLERQDAVATPWTPDGQQGQRHTSALTPGLSITEIYDQSGGELLILGEAGSGKSTLLLQLARELLDRAEQDDGAPIPVIFLLSSWAEKQLPIDQWLVEELNSKYQVPRLLGGMWLHSEILLPLLDGLDEVAESVRSACIIAINEYKQQHGLSSLVVCSRLTDYLLFPPRVLLKRAVVVQSLTIKQVTDYLQTGGKRFEGINQILHVDPILQRLITTPLMLNIIMLAYKDKSPNELVKMHSAKDRYQQIFHTYVEEMLKRHPSNTSSLAQAPQQLVSWLTSLARKMQQRGQVVFYIEQIQPEWIDKERWQQVYLWLAVLLPGALIGALIGLLSNDVLFHAGDFKSIFLDSIYGLIMGFLFSGRRPEQEVLENRRISQRIPKKSRSTGTLLLTPVFLGAVSILFLARAKGLPDGLINGTYLGIMSLPLSLWLQRRTKAKSERRNASSTFARLEAKYPLIEHFMNGLIIGPICGVSNILTNVIRQGLTTYSPSFYVSLGIRETLHNFLIGTLISLLVLSANNGEIHRSEIIIWSWKRFWSRVFVPKYIAQGLLIGLFAGLTYGIKATLGGSLTDGLTDGLTTTLMLVPGYILITAILYGISNRNLADQHRHKANEGIYRSLYHGLVGSVIGVFAAAAGYIFSTVLASVINDVIVSAESKSHVINLQKSALLGIQQGLQLDYHNVLGLGLAGGILAFLLLGGLAALQHAILRLILWMLKVLPMDITSVMDYATDSVFLHKVGGGYMFIHRFLLEYFASLEQKEAVHADHNKSKTSRAERAEPLVRLL